MWVAKDKDNKINLFLIKPIRDEIEGFWHTDDWEYPESESMPIYNKMFPDLKWDDEPIEVELNEYNPFYFKLSKETAAYSEKDTRTTIEELRNKPLFDDYELQVEARKYAENKRPNWKDFLYQYIQDAYYDGFIKGVNKFKDKLR